MFNPIGSTIPQPLTLVATALPTSIALRVPYDNVAPTVSSAELNNNASGNRTNSPKSDIQAQSLTTNVQTENFSVPRNNPINFSNSSQTAFLAQLASGDISSEVRGIFAQYEKLVNFANVKYKPSNAGKPVDPVSSFKTLLQIEKENPTPQPENVEQPVATSAQEPIGIPELIEPELTKELAIPQLQTVKYTETVSRNNNYEQKDLELA